MASTRTTDRLVGGLVGALLVLLLLGVLAAVAFLSVSEPSGPGSAPAPGAPAPAPSPGPALSPPEDLAAGQTWLGDVVLDAGSLLTPEADLRDVSAVGSAVLTGPGGIRAGRLAVEATVPFDVVAQQIAPGVTVAPAPRGQASVARTVEVLGREVDVVATGTVEVVAGRLVVEPRRIDVGGASFLADALAAAARQLVTVEQEVAGLPEGLVLREVEVTDDGFRARLDGEDVLVATVPSS